MDDVLVRMLAVEQEAAQMAVDAEAEADRVREEGRQETAAELERRRRELDGAVRTLMADRVTAAEREKADALRVAEERLERRAREFADAVAVRADLVVQTLAYPEGAGDRGVPHH